MAMKCVKHLVPVGFTPEVLAGSIRRFPVDGVILVRGKDRSLPNAEKAEEAARSVREALGSVPCEDFFVDVDDIEGAALSLVGRIIAERASGCEVLVNLSGSIRSLGVAAYLAALSSGAPAYIGLPDYKGGVVCGVRKVVSVPLMPLKELSREKQEIMLSRSGASGGADAWGLDKGGWQGGEGEGV